MKEILVQNGVSLVIIMAHKGLEVGCGKLKEQKV